MSQVFVFAIGIAMQLQFLQYLEETTLLHDIENVFNDQNFNTSGSNENLKERKFKISKISRTSILPNNDIDVF